MCSFTANTNVSKFTLFLLILLFLAVSVLFFIFRGKQVCCYEGGLLSGQPLIRVVSHLWSFIRMVCYESGFSLGWSVIRVVCHHDGCHQLSLSSGIPLRSSWNSVTQVIVSGLFCPHTFRQKKNPCFQFQSPDCPYYFSLTLNSPPPPGKLRRLA